MPQINTVLEVISWHVPALTSFSPQRTANISFFYLDSSGWQTGIRYISIKTIVVEKHVASPGLKHSNLLFHRQSLLVNVIYQYHEIKFSSSCMFKNYKNKLFNPPPPKNI